MGGLKHRDKPTWLPYSPRSILALSRPHTIVRDGSRFLLMARDKISNVVPKDRYFPALLSNINVKSSKVTWYQPSEPLARDLMALEKLVEDQFARLRELKVSGADNHATFKYDWEWPFYVRMVIDHALYSLTRAEKASPSNPYPLTEIGDAYLQIALENMRKKQRFDNGVNRTHQSSEEVEELLADEPATENTEEGDIRQPGK